MSSDNVLKLIKEQDVKFVDLRFCDTIGKEQHVTVPASVVDKEMLKEGKMFEKRGIRCCTASRTIVLLRE